MGESKGPVKFGFKNVHYALISEGEDGALAYGTPVPIPGAVNVTLDSQGDEVDFEADDSLYYTAYSYTGKKGTIEVAKIPDQFRKDILHEKENPTNHVLFEDASAEPSPFALLFETGGNEKPTRFVWYYCTVSRPSENASTTGKTKTPQTESMSITATALTNGIVRARTTEKTTDTVYNNWFKSVLEPDAGEETVSAQTESAPAQAEAVQGGT